MNRSDRKLTFFTLFPEATSIHLNKDVGMIPFVLGKHFNYDAYLASYPDNSLTVFDNEFKDFKIVYIEKVFDNMEKDAISFLERHAQHIDILQVYHLTDYSLRWIHIYKTLRPNGIVHLKLDAAVQAAVIQFEPQVYEWLRAADLITVESKALRYHMNQFWPVPVTYLPNGFYEHVPMTRISYSEKENIILTAGRLGTYQKATEVLLAAFKIAEPFIPGWKLRLLGSIEEPFKEKITQYFDENPRLIEKVTFAGHIADLKALASEYRKAKVFCLPSRNEGFPLVLPEAAKSGCYIIATDLPASYDITNNQQYGDLFPVDDAEQLAVLLIDNCNNERRLEQVCNGIQTFIREHYNWLTICETLDEKLKSLLAQKYGESI